ncbi:MAG TPA: DUF2182 domain-containing protein [Vicinamibacterales bacterium]|nr:DUF2182 domain-containing protein [Vicinamibacterales bacterium]
MRDRVIVTTGIVGLTALAWVYLVRMAHSMAAMSMPEMNMWAVPDVSMLIVMWVVMMVAMMLPSAAPMIVLAVGTYRRRAGGPAAWAMGGAFALGYLLAWTGFSVVAALAQAGLHRAAWLSPAMSASNAWLGGAILIVAGVYQWLPVKARCLTHCRSPLNFLMTAWREGLIGAVRMGVHHGKFCIGCCWALMLLLFVAGVMNLVWVAAIAVLVLVEKVLPLGSLAGRLTGAALIVWGVLVALK